MTRTHPVDNAEHIEQPRVAGGATGIRLVPAGLPVNMHWNDAVRVRRHPRHRRRVPSTGLSDGGFCWVAAHGGAGATSLALVLGGTDAGCRWPDPAESEPARVLLVARTHAAGMQAASRALNAMREGRHPAGMELVVLVLVADAPGRLPLSLSSRVRVLRSVAPVCRIPWIPEWRSGKRAKALPKQLSRLGELVGARPVGAGERL
jgi:hypothetical protein